MANTNSRPFMISFTGVDDQTSIADLIHLTDGHAQDLDIQWGVLIHPEKQGTGRNPSWDYVRTLVREFRQRYGGGTILLTGHMCGREIFQGLLDQRSDIVEIFQLFNSVQININARGRIFSTEQVHKVYDHATAMAREVVLQYNADTASDIDSYLMRYYRQDTSTINILYDASRGKRVLPSQWPTNLNYEHLGAERRYAGGLTPDNVRQACRDICTARDSLEPCQPYYNPSWAIDMESGIRTDDKFDLEKVKAVIKNVYS